MELKKAVAVCLISLFSATLVVLIARSLDSQAASRLEPQLAAIVEELRAIRSQAGPAAEQGHAATIETPDNGLMVYYFHGNIRCPTCRAIESQAEETVRNDFASSLGKKDLIWKIVNYERPSSKSLAGKFDVQMPVVVLARMKDGQVRDWRRLDEVWALVSDKPAFEQFVREAIEQMLASDKQPATDTTSPPAPDIPIP